MIGWQLKERSCFYSLTNDSWEGLFFSNFFLKFIYLFIYLWLCWVFVSVRGLSLVAASGGHSSSRCASLSLSRPLLLRSTGSRRACSVIVAHGPSCSAACGIFPDQASNPCPALAGRLSTTAPPGKPWEGLFKVRRSFKPFNRLHNRFFSASNLSKS